jgi:hypothetical protein
MTIQTALLPEIRGHKKFNHEWTRIHANKMPLKLFSNARLEAKICHRQTAKQSRES